MCLIYTLFGVCRIMRVLRLQKWILWHVGLLKVTRLITSPTIHRILEKQSFLTPSTPIVIYVYCHPTLPNVFTNAYTAGDYVAKKNVFICSLG